MRGFLTGAFCLFATVPLLAQEGPFGPAFADAQHDAPQPIKRIPYPDSRIRVVFDLISVSRESAFEIVRLSPDMMWQRLLLMMKEGSAISEDVIASAASDGMGSTFEGSEERRYPTEFVPPDVPDGDPKELTSRDVLRMSIVPKAYEIATIGTTLEVYTKTRGPNVEVTFDFRVKKIYDFWIYPLRLPPTIPSIGQPVFGNCQVHRTVAGKIDAPLFVQASDFSRNGPSGKLDRLLLVFVTAIRD